MYFLINYLIAQGFTKGDLSLVLALPVLITLFSLSRQLIGLRGLGLTCGILVTLVITLSGIKFGLAIIVVSLIVFVLLRFLMRKWRLLYLPKTALILTFGLIILLLFAALPLGLSQKSSLLALVLILAIAEKVILLQMEKNNREVFFNILETLVLSTLGASIILWPPLQSLALNRPDVIIVASIIVNIALGRWTGLRLNEYWRFRQVIKNIK